MHRETIASATSGDGLGATPERVVGDGPAGQPGGAGQTVSKAFDEQLLPLARLSGSFPDVLCLVV
jgi:hypothetical protein